MIQGTKESRWQDIYSHLTAKGLQVYAPTQKKGECKSPYVVVKDNGVVDMNSVSSVQHLYDILCYVPHNKYSELELYVNQVKAYMDELFPMLRPAHLETPSFYDDAVKAHMVSIEYINYRKKKRK